MLPQYRLRTSRNFWPRWAAYVLAAAVVAAGLAVLIKSGAA
jgi:hypothetical protein